MAVFTTFSRASLERYLVMFELGELSQFEPIAAGIENSNYFVTLNDHNEFVLTITENLSFEDVPFFNDLFQKLERSGLPVPNPVSTLDGMKSTIFCGKPTWLFPKLSGAHLLAPKADHCKAVGRALAGLHEASASAQYTRPNPYDEAFVKQALENKGHLLAANDRELLETIAEEYAGAALDLPRGIIHGDLFRDNVFFDNDILTGMIDFYHACEDFLAQDLAITINDWCTNPDGTTDEDRSNAFLTGYEEIRQLSSEEKRTLCLLRKNAALRFCLTRLLSGEDANHLKDPEEFLRIARDLVGTDG